MYDETASLLEQKEAQIPASPLARFGRHLGGSGRKFEGFSIVTAASGWSGNGCAAKTRFWGRISAVFQGKRAAGRLFCSGQESASVPGKRGPVLVIFREIFDPKCAEYCVRQVFGDQSTGMLGQMAASLGRNVLAAVAQLAHEEVARAI